MAEIQYVEKSAKLTILKANYENNWVTLKIVNKSNVYIKVDDAFARCNGFNSLQHMKDAEPGFKKSCDECAKDADNVLWLLIDVDSHEYLGIRKNALN